MDYNTVCDKLNMASALKTSFIHFTVSTEQDRHRAIPHTTLFICAASASRGEKKTKVITANRLQDGSEKLRSFAT